MCKLTMMGSMVAIATSVTLQALGGVICSGESVAMRSNSLMPDTAGRLLTEYTTTWDADVPQIRNVKVFQQYPWESKVFITYEVMGDIAANAESGHMPFLHVTAIDNVSGRTYEATCLSGDIGTEKGLHRIVWDVLAQGVSINSDTIAIRVVYRDEPVFLVVDLSSGANSKSYPISYFSTIPSSGWSDDYKTTKLVLRRIAPGTFNMRGLTSGGIVQEMISATLTKSYYIGVFEVTQKQYELVMGANPSVYKGEKCPVAKVTYDMLRGSSLGAQWPSSSEVDSSSFIGKLRARTGLNFDLPTEAQWEYACRAGTTSNYNNGGDTEDDLKVLGRYSGNRSDGKGGYSDHYTTVGSYLPNGRGVYDMHGNVLEWCLDWYENSPAGGVDPKGPSSGHYRVARGGNCDNPRKYCTSSSPYGLSPSYDGYETTGVRLVTTMSD